MAAPIPPVYLVLSTLRPLKKRRNADQTVFADLQVVLVNIDVHVPTPDQVLTRSLGLARRIDGNACWVQIEQALRESCRHPFIGRPLEPGEVVLAW